MKKTSFYSRVREHGKNTVKLQNGYCDGDFYYYKNYSTWYAIHPLVGLPVTYGYTRAEAAEKAHAPELMKKMQEVIQARGEALTAEFEEAIIKYKREQLDKN